MKETERQIISTLITKKDIMDLIDKNFLDGDDSYHTTIGNIVDIVESNETVLQTITFKKILK